MTKFVVLIFGICVLNAHCAVYRNAVEHPYRQVRSPHYGGQIFFGPPPPGPPPPPPPPSFLYQTRNWSGVSRGYGGRSNGVFSGASAATGSAPPAAGEALALATAEASGGQSENCDDAASNNLGQSRQFGAKLGQFNSKSFRSGSVQYSGQIKSSGSDLAENQSDGLQAGFSGSNSNSVASGLAGSGSLGGGSDNIGSSGLGGQSREYKSHSSSFVSSSANSDFSGHGQQNNGFNSQAPGVALGVSGYPGGSQGGQHYKEAHFSEGLNIGQLNNGGSLSHGGLSGNQQASSKGFENAQSQSSLFGNAGSFDGSQGSGYSKLDAGLDSNNQAASESQGQLSSAGSEISSGFAYGKKGYGNSHYHGGHDRSEQFQSGGHFGQSVAEGSSASGGQEASAGVTRGTSRGDAYSAFNGALDLASQGLQAADKAGCSTCQKSSYALSNAKSYNGNAISLAIGG